MSEFTQSDLILRDDSPQMQYEPMGDKTHNVHKGQLKLMLADELALMQALLHISSCGADILPDIVSRNKKVAVLVAGGAPGEHFVDLSTTFHFLDFHLYDPAIWNHKLQERDTHSNVHLYTQYFDINTATQWESRTSVEGQKYVYVIFLCDLRVPTKDHPDALVEVDMKLQRSLTEQIRAEYTVLKFHPPYYQDKNIAKTYEYLDGTIYLEAFPPRNSSETRLHVTDPKSTKTYDIQKYENQLAYHNQETRMKTDYDNRYMTFVQKYIQSQMTAFEFHFTARGKFSHDIHKQARLQCLITLLVDMNHMNYMDY